MAAPLFCSDACFNQDAEALKALLADDVVLHAGWHQARRCAAHQPRPPAPAPVPVHCAARLPPSADRIVTDQDRKGPADVAQFFAKFFANYKSEAEGPLRCTCTWRQQRSPTTHLAALKRPPLPPAGKHFPVVRAVNPQARSAFCLWDEEARGAGAAAGAARARQRRGCTC